MKRWRVNWRLLRKFNR